MKKRSKGEGTIRKRADGRWEGRYIDTSGQTRYLYETNKSRLREKLTQVSYVKDLNMYNEIGGDVSLNVWYQHYIGIKKYQVKERSLNQTKMIIEKHILPIIGNKILFQINMNDILILVNRLEEQKLSKTTIYNITNHLKAMFNFAKEEGVIQKNPMLTFRFKPNKNTRRALTKDEISIILSTAKQLDPKFHLMLCTLLYTGIRVGELCGLRWNDFYDDFSYMTIDESFTDLRFEQTTKTDSSVRSIPLNSFLSNAYRDMYKSANAERDSIVFVNKFNRPYYSDLLSRRLKFIKQYIVERLDIPIDMNITPHYFRHTFTSIGIENGINIKDMQELLGHADTRTLLEVYSHTTHSRKVDAINKIQDALSITD